MHGYGGRQSEEHPRNADQDREELARGLARAAGAKMKRERAAGSALSALLIWIRSL